MGGLGQSIFEEGREEGIPKEKTLIKLQKRFGLIEEKARYYYERFALEES